MKKTVIEVSEFRATMQYLGVTLQDFSSFAGISLDYSRSLSSGRRTASVVIFRLLQALLDQQETTGTNDCKRHAQGEIE
jgi:hypothetical protein